MAHAHEVSDAAAGEREVIRLGVGMYHIQD